MKLSSAQVATLVPIRKMSRAITFYTKSLGAKIVQRGRGPMRDSWAWIRIGEIDLWLVVPEQREKRTLAYTTFLVQTIGPVVQELVGKKVKFQKATRSSPSTRVEGPIAHEPWGSSAFFRDSEGNLFMLWQTNPPN